MGCSSNRICGAAGSAACWVARACELARELGAAGLNVIANPHAFDFYHAVGFVDCGTAETQFGPATLMRLPLAAAEDSALR